MTVVAGCATDPTYGVTVYDVIVDPPFDGADQLTVADPFPATADTPVGAPGAVRVDAADLNTMAAASQGVLPPVPKVAFGVAPEATTWSSTKNSMSPVGDTFTRWVHPDPAVNESPNPESA